MATEQPTDYASMQSPEPSPSSPSAVHCPRCGRENPPEERRCLRCQSRLPGAGRAYQPMLDLRPDWPKVIPFEWIAPDRTPRPPRRSAAASAAGRTRIPPGSRPAQPALPLEMPGCLPRGPVRDYGIEAPPAPLSQRAGAALLDGIFLVVGSLLFLTALHLSGGPVAIHKATAPYYALAALTLALFYKLFFCILNCDSPGVKVARLELIHFDRRAPSVFQRLLRLAMAGVSLLGLGAGWLWALLDREGLSWHDIVSKTYLVKAGALPEERPCPTAARARL